MTERSAAELLEMIRGAVRDQVQDAPVLTAAINATDNPEVYRELGMMLACEPPSVRIFAAAAFGDAGNPEVLEALDPLLSDAHPVVRLHAVTAVAEHGAVDDMVPLLASLIANDPSAQVRLLAVHALFIVRDNPQAATVLAQASADPDPDVRAAARRMLAK